MKNSIRIYEVKHEYVKYLCDYQKHIFLQNCGKNNRKYIGVILIINDIKYFAPLSSYKEKHKKMKEGIDFIKIKEYAVINLNNMIPVPDSQIVNIDINKEREQNLFIIIRCIRVVRQHWRKERMILLCWKNCARNISFKTNIAIMLPIWYNS